MNKYLATPTPYVQNNVSNVTWSPTTQILVFDFLATPCEVQFMPLKQCCWTISNLRCTKRLWKTITGENIMGHHIHGIFWSKKKFGEMSFFFKLYSSCCFFCQKGNSKFQKKWPNGFLFFFHYKKKQPQKLETVQENQGRFPMTLSSIVFVWSVAVSTIFGQKIESPKFFKKWASKEVSGHRSTWCARILIFSTLLNGHLIMRCMGLIFVVAKCDFSFLDSCFQIQFSWGGSDVQLGWVKLT